MMTKQEYIDSQIATWGEDYIFDLYDRGYVVTFVESLGKWSFVLASDFAEREYPKMSYVG